jgi:hypothetical protein
MCEISGATHLHGVKRIVTADGIHSRWLQMIEDYPDRVMMGTDPCCELMRRYGDIVQLMRTKALAAMKPETLVKVAYQKRCGCLDCQIKNLNNKWIQSPIALAISFCEGHWGLMNLGTEESRLGFDLARHCLG